MPHSTLGNPQMNSMSDSSVVNQQTGKAQEAPQHLLDPVTTLPYIDEYMNCKYWDVHSNDHLTSVDYRKMSVYNLHNSKGWLLKLDIIILTYITLQKMYSFYLLFESLSFFSFEM